MKGSQHSIAPIRLAFTTIDCDGLHTCRQRLSLPGALHVSFKAKTSRQYLGTQEGVHLRFSLGWGSRPLIAAEAEDLIPSTGCGVFNVRNT